MKILVATDGSEFSKAAIEQCCDLIKDSEKISIRIISAANLLPPVPAGFFSPSASVTRDEINKAINKKAASSVAQAETAFRKRFPDSIIEITTKVIDCSPKRAILEEAENWDADLIVIGSHGYGFWTRALIGSVSESVLNHARSSVLVARKSKLLTATDKNPAKAKTGVMAIN